MTGETESNTTPWIEEHGVEYAYGYLSKEEMGVFMKAAGMRGYPSALLVDSRGEVVWSGHPASLTGSTIKKHLRGADRTPVNVRALARKWPEAAEDVVRAFAKGDLVDALKEARDLPQEIGASVVADLDRVVESRVSALTALHEAGDYLGFEDAMDDIGATLKGLPPGDELAAKLKELGRDRDAKAILSAQKKLRVMEARALEERKAKDLARWIEAVQKLARDHPGTIVETHGAELVKKLVDRRERLD